MSELKGGKDLGVTPGFRCETLAPVRVCWSVFMFAALQLHLGLKGICPLSS